MVSYISFITSILFYCNIFYYSFCSCKAHWLGLTLSSVPSLLFQRPVKTPWWPQPVTPSLKWPPWPEAEQMHLFRGDGSHSFMQPLPFLKGQRSHMLALVTLSSLHIYSSTSIPACLCMASLCTFVPHTHFTHFTLLTVLVSVVVETFVPFEQYFLWSSGIFKLNSDSLGKNHKKKSL